MKIYRYFYIILPLALLSCSNDDNLPGDERTGNIVKDITVSYQGATVAPGLALEGDADEHISPAIILDQFSPGDKLYFSQMGPTSTQDPNFSNYEENASPYCYIYEYDENDEATWASGFNFSLHDTTRQPFKWETVTQVGSVGNAFSFYAFYYPINNTPVWNVQTDQRGSGEDVYDTGNFLVSDIMGAYHASSAIYTRMRFRLFHLMVYLKVTLYVPVYEAEADGTGYSGFGEGAMQGALVLNAVPDINIEWRANRTSDTYPPLTQPGNNMGKQNIVMYQHKPDEEVIENFEVSNYYTGGTLTVDNVRAYNFSVLFPAQSFDNNFLCFVLRSQDDSLRYFYFSGNQIVGDSGNYSLTQGTLQHLSLYLPRTANETILVRANILPWSDSLTDMTVTEQPSSQDPNN